MYIFRSFFYFINIVNIWFYRKQAWLWMQGDLHRSKSKDRTRTRHHSVSKLLSGVDDMRIQDSFDYQYQSDDDVIIDFIITVCFRPYKKKCLGSQTNFVKNGWGREFFFVFFSEVFFLFSKNFKKMKCTFKKQQLPEPRCMT